MNFLISKCSWLRSCDLVFTKLSNHKAQKNVKSTKINSETDNQIIFQNSNGFLTAPSLSNHGNGHKNKYAGLKEIYVSFCTFWGGGLSYQELSGHIKTMTPFTSFGHNFLKYSECYTSATNISNICICRFQLGGGR